MGDPFSEENIALFEEQRGSPKRPPSAYLPFGRPLSDIMEEPHPGGMPDMAQDIVRQESKGEIEDSPKPFEFVIR